MRATGSATVFQGWQLENRSRKGESSIETLSWSLPPLAYCRGRPSRGCLGTIGLK